MEEESEKKPTIAELRPRNKEEQEARKKQGSILGWIKLNRDVPQKQAVQPVSHRPIPIPKRTRQLPRHPGR
jgi:hypothetical protein